MDAGAGSAVSVPAQETQVPDAADSTVSHPPLWRNLQFQTLWIRASISTLGVAVADVAYPLAILAITGSPRRAALFAALGFQGVVPLGQMTRRPRCASTEVARVSWRWRESNPRPSVHHQGFSGCSLLRFSQPRQSHRLAADGLSRC
jgi:hypothetical protein